MMDPEDLHTAVDDLHRRVALLEARTVRFWGPDGEAMADLKAGSFVSNAEAMKWVALLSAADQIVASLPAHRMWTEDEVALRDACRALRP